MANTILQTPIINANGKDILVWKLTPAGEFCSKSAYKHCFNNLQLPPRQRTKIVPMRVISLLNKVWKDKQMAPRVQTFAWRLLRKALPTGKRAGRYSKHINENCSRCGQLEDEMHMLFLCPFSKAAWFWYPWFIKTESLAEHYHSIPDMIHALVTSQHPQINSTSLYTFLWCLWKARNDCLFCRKLCKPSQVYAAANAIIEATKLEDKNSTQQQESDQAQEQLQASPTTTHTQDSNNLAGNVIFCDAAWERHTDSEMGHAGLGVIITMQDNLHLQQLHVSALSPPASSPLQAETYGLLLATKLADLLQVQNPHFYTNCSVLASAARSSTVFAAPGCWENRPLLAEIQASSSFNCNKITHISRSNNVKADHQARLALRIQTRSLAIRCLCTQAGQGQCPGKDILSGSSMAPFMLLSVKCT